MAMIFASVDVTLVVWRATRFLMMLFCQIWAMAVAVSFFTPPSAIIQMLDIEDCEEEKAFFRQVMWFFLFPGPNWTMKRKKIERENYQLI